MFDFDIVTKNWGKEKFDIHSKFAQLVELRPTEIHLKEDGTLTDGPLFAIVMSIPNNDKLAAVGQVSLEMLNGAMNRLGYQITPLQKEGTKA